MCIKTAEGFETILEDFVNQSHWFVVKAVLLGVTFMIAGIAYAQIDSPVVVPEQDSSNLFERAAASRFVVVGTVTQIDGVTKRLTKDLETKIKADGNLSLIVGGPLYVIAVESIVCRQEDFLVKSTGSSAVPKQVYVFVPRDEPEWVDGKEREVFSPGERYILFLTLPDQKTLDRWITIYDLDPQRPYFRGEQRGRGVVPLKPKAGHILDQVSRLCGAMRPPELAQKLTALKDLENSGDPVLEEEARVAEKKLRTAKTN